MLKKLSTSFAVVISILSLNVAGAFAHVVVKPAQVGVGAFQTFMTGVPNEKQVDVTGIRLVIPDSLKYVTPNVKTGWQIDVKKTGEGEDAKVSEINWTGGTIPAGFRDEFVFSAQVPAKEATIQWKAYQTYADGTVVAWDQAPDASKSEDELTPFSQTKVINDLAATTTKTATTTTTDSTNRANVALTVGIVGLIFGLAALAASRRK